MVNTAGQPHSAVPILEHPESEHTLGDVEPAGSRQNWRRSAVAVADDRVVAGTASGTVSAFHADGTPQWSVSDGPDTPIVSLSVTDELVIAGHRGPEGRVRVLSAETGTVQWEYVTAEDVGSPTDETLFAQPYVVESEHVDDLLVVASRRFERDGSDRQWSSVVYGFELDGSLRWAFDAERSVTGFDIGSEVVAIGYNRCPVGDNGLVVLEKTTGEQRFSWTPEMDGDRAVGDVAVTDVGIAVASHADKYGYLLDWNGNESWSVNLGGEHSVGDETIYSYPNHVAVSDGTAIFVTGNTFAAETRDPAHEHPAEHTTVGVDLETGEFQWKYHHGGFAREIATGGSLVAVPSAQQFRVRDSDTHKIHLLDVTTGDSHSVTLAGIPAALDFDGRSLAAIEEPIEYHDEGVEHGTYQLLAWEIDSS